MKVSLIKRCTFLKELYRLSQEGAVFNYKICKEYNISYTFFRALIDIGILKPDNGYYIWIVGEPSQVMCQQVYDRETALNNDWRMKKGKINSPDDLMKRLKDILYHLRKQGIDVDVIVKKKIITIEEEHL